MYLQGTTAMSFDKEQVTPVAAKKSSFLGLEGASAVAPRDSLAWRFENPEGRAGCLGPMYSTRQVPAPKSLFRLSEEDTKTAVKKIKP